MLPKIFLKRLCFLVLLLLAVNTWARTPPNSLFSPTSEVVGPSVTNAATHFGSPSDINFGGLPSSLVSNRDISLDTPKIKGNKLVGSGTVGSAYQGTSVSLSADGKTAIVGGPGDDGGKGAAWIYQNVNGVWQQEGNKLVGSGAVGVSVQGISVALSENGNTAIVGGPGDDDSKGAVWIYQKVNGVWRQQGNKLVGKGAVGVAGQGISVSLSADGKIAIVGGPEDHYNRGAVWIFCYKRGKWRQMGSKLLGLEAVDEAKQGYSVSLSRNGETAIVGGYAADSGKGAVWIFRYINGVWRQEGSKLVGSGAVGVAKQGSAVSLSADGKTAIFGGRGDDGNEGALWIFSNLNGVWHQNGNKLVGEGAVGNALQGTSVALSADGKTAIVGGPYDDGGKGAIWIYRKVNVVWLQAGSKLLGFRALNEITNQGYSVDLSADGKTAIVGGPGDDGGKGAVWIFSNDNVDWNQY